MQQINKCSLICEKESCNDICACPGDLGRWEIEVTDYGENCSAHIVKEKSRLTKNSSEGCSCLSHLDWQGFIPAKQKTDGIKIMFRTGHGIINELSHPARIFFY